MKLKETKTVICQFRNGKKLILENIVSVFSHEKIIEFCDSEHVDSCVMLDALDYYMVQNKVVYKDGSSIFSRSDFTIDWGAGYDAACEDIKDFCIEKQDEIVREIENPDTWNKGFLAGLLCIQKEIEEGCFNGRFTRYY